MNSEKVLELWEFGNQSALNNNVLIYGNLKSDFVFSHESKYSYFYKNTLRVKRHLGNEDLIPIMMSDVYFGRNPIKVPLAGKFVKIRGKFASYNKHDAEGKSHLELYVLIYEMEFLNVPEMYTPYTSIIYLDGYICKKPILRVTPKGTYVCDLFMAVNRKNSDVSDYFPLIAWKNDAKWSSHFAVGSRIQIYGRIQSRNYLKVIDDVPISKTAIEISIAIIQKANQ